MLVSPVNKEALSVPSPDNNTDANRCNAETNKVEICAENAIAPTKDKPPASSNWTWTRIAKYGAAVAVVALATPQLLRLARNVSQVAAVVSTMKEAVPSAVTIVNEAASGFQAGTYAVGSVISGIRVALNSMNITTPPVPNTTATITGLGATYISNSWVASAALAGMSVPLAFLILAAKATGYAKAMAGPAAAASFGYLALETAKPGVGSALVEATPPALEKMVNATSAAVREQPVASAVLGLGTLYTILTAIRIAAIKPKAPVPALERIANDLSIIAAGITLPLRAGAAVMPVGLE